MNDGEPARKLCRIVNEIISSEDDEDSEQNVVENTDVIISHDFESDDDDTSEETMAKQPVDGISAPVAGAAQSHARVTMVKNTTVHVHGNVTTEHITNKMENCEGPAIIHHGGGAGASNIQQQAQQQEALEECFEISHRVLLETETIEMEMVGLKRPKKIRLPRIVVATKDEMLVRSKKDENYDPTNSAYPTHEWEKNIVKYEEAIDKDGFTLVGSGGAGKSTLLKILMKDVIQRRLKKCDKIKLVVYIELKSVKGDEVGTIDEVLLAKAVNIIALDLEQRPTLLKWIKKNPFKILFVMDGYDQMINSRIAKDERIATDLYGRASASQFVHGILSKSILRGAMVVLSTREYSLQQMPHKSVSDKILKLVGFSDEDIEQVIVDMSNKNVLAKIKKSDLVVFILCSSPLILTFVIWSYTEVTDCKQPETKSGILMQVILHFVTSPSHSRGTTILNLLKLARLALYGILNGKVVFSDGEIRDHGLKLDDLKDMIVGVPGKMRRFGNKERIMAGDFRRYFLHQSLQEIMAALDIILSNSENFDEILSELDGAYYEEIYLLLIGLIFREENKDMVSLLLNEIKDAKRTANSQPVLSHEEPGTSASNEQTTSCNTAEKESHILYVAMEDHETEEELKLSFFKGDHLMIMEKGNGEWWKARTIKHSVPKHGLIPSKFVRPATELESKPWYYKVSLQEAEDLLKSLYNKRGTFLIRPCKNREGCYILSLLAEDSLRDKTVDHCLILKLESGLFKINNLEFESLDKLVEHCSNNERIPCKLRKPCPNKLQQTSASEFDAWKEDRESLKARIALNAEPVWKGKPFVLDKLIRLKEIALRHLQGRLEGNYIADLRTMRLLYESGESSIIQNHVKGIGLNMTNKFDAFCIGKIFLKSIQLSNVCLNKTSDELLRVLMESCNNRIPEIDALRIVKSTNFFGKNLAKIANRSMKVELLTCEFTKEEFESFVDELDKHEKFNTVRFSRMRIEMEHVDALKRLMAHIKGKLVLQLKFGSATNISEDVKKEIPMQYQECRVEYYQQ